MSKKYINTIPRDAFSIIDESLSKKNNIINLSIGNPIDSPNECLINKLNEYILDEKSHGYGFTDKNTQQELKKSMANYYKRRFGTNLDIDNEVEILNGTKEGIYYLISSMVDEDESILIPSPSYSVYMNIAHLIGAKSIYFKCEKESFMPNLESIKEEDLLSAKVMILCSPGNPTTKILSKEFLMKAIDLAKKYDFKIIHDLAYGELCYKGNDVISILSLPGGSDVAVELYSLSKTCNIAGWRIGFAIGNKEVLSNLRILKSNIDFGMFIPFQKTAIYMIENMHEYSLKQSKVYEEKIEYFVSELNRIGWNVKFPEGSFFIWAKIPKQYAYMEDTDFVRYIFDKTNVLLLPGSGFGYGGRGYVRIALVENLEVLKKAIKNLERLFCKEDESENIYVL